MPLEPIELQDFKAALAESPVVGNKVLSVNGNPVALRLFLENGRRISVGCERYEGAFGEGTRLCFGELFADEDERAAA